MNRIILTLFGIMFISRSTALAYDSNDLNRRLNSCTPTKDFDAGSSIYQITGLMGSYCVFKILYVSSSRSDLICKVPYSKMREITSYNPLTVQDAKRQYCTISLRKFDHPKKSRY